MLFLFLEMISLSDDEWLVDPYIVEMIHQLLIQLE